MQRRHPYAGAVSAATFIRDYRQAVGQAADHRLQRSGLRAACEVGKAKLAYGFGPRYFSLYSFDRRPEQEWSSFVNDVWFKPLLRRVNPKAVRARKVDDKFGFYEHCLQHGLTTIPVLALLGKRPGSLASDTENALSQWTQAIEHAPDRLFVKLIDGTWGMDAFVAARQAPGRWRFDGNEGTAADFHAFALQRLKGRSGWVVQPFLSNHVDLVPVSSGKALSTVRMVTVWREGQAELVFAVARLPVGSALADNFGHGSSGNLVAPVNLPTGELGKAWGSRSRHWPDIVSVERHPDTGAPIDGVPLPHWHDAVRLVCRGQASLPELPTLGWDVALCHEGPVLVEVNGTYDIDLVQVAMDRGVLADVQRMGLSDPALLRR